MRLHSSIVRMLNPVRAREQLGHVMVCRPNLIMLLVEEVEDQPEAGPVEEQLGVAAVISRHPVPRLEVIRQVEVATRATPNTRPRPASTALPTTTSIPLTTLA